MTNNGIDKKFPSSFPYSKYNFTDYTKRLYTTIGEPIWNLFAHRDHSNDTHSVLIAELIHNKYHYLMVAHNGSPMNSIDEVLNYACTPSISKSKGIFGSGLSYSAYMCSPDGSEHVIIACKTESNELIAGKGFVSNDSFSGWETEDVSSEWKNVLRQLLGACIISQQIFKHFILLGENRNDISRKYTNTQVIQSTIETR